MNLYKVTYILLNQLGDFEQERYLAAKSLNGVASANPNFTRIELVSSDLTIIEE